MIKRTGYRSLPDPIGFVIVREKEDALLEEVRKLAKEIDSQHAILPEELQ
jgi:hypothetical protein